jgi:hypothetical protein
MNYKPSNSQEMHMQSEVAILGVIKRLKEYARHPEHQDLQCDLDIAANVIDYFVRTSDDFK